MRRMRNYLVPLLLGMSLAGCATEGSGSKPTVTSHSSQAAGVAVTMVHFGAPW